MYSEQTLYGLDTVESGDEQAFDHEAAVSTNTVAPVVDDGPGFGDAAAVTPWEWFGSLADGRRRAEDDDDLDDDFDDDEDDDFDDDLDDDFDDDDFDDDDDDDDDDFDDDFDEDDL